MTVGTGRIRRALVIIPVYNEEATLDRVLAEVRRHAPDCDVVVVDDGSTDRSPDILRRHPVEVIRHEVNRGYGASLISGFRRAVEGGYEAAVTLDCDEQHEPRQIPAFLAALERADIVSGSRYLDPTLPGDPPPPDRYRINQEFVALLRAITGYPLTDAWCGFKAYRGEALRLLELTEPSYGMPLQVWVQAAARGLRVVELPVARIYKNPRRTFWGGLDDPDTRRAYYLSVLEAEVARWLPDRLPLVRERTP
ncbi:MAG: glycosyltransferase family 2 protein [Armatimonadota bacterium]|nr:glycosyltransferase family 2 protein [Armatimonadota bacterium]MDR7404087.1 glycosyltransferase family 2 protein [Armatimonadota bacterium]